MITAITNFCNAYFNNTTSVVIALAAQGSDRQYYRITNNNTTYIAVYSADVKENEAFIKFSSHFVQSNVPVPTILHFNNERTMYLQNDFGTTCLFDVLNKQGFTNEVYALYQHSLKNLANMQIQGAKGFDTTYCVAGKEFNRSGFYADLLYFNYYFVRPTKTPYHKTELLTDFDTLSDYLMGANRSFFMHRDFQSRNIMVANNTPHFIDYQGGMLGALQYDVASLLWQAKAQLPYEWRNSLFDYYYEQAKAQSTHVQDKLTFTDHYNAFVLLRLLQVLGAYGFRGLFEGRPHFVDSIVPALENLKWFVANKRLPLKLNALYEVLNHITQPNFIAQFKVTKATETSRLQVTITSFSYKRAIPTDTSGNGGGFVFDCRGVHNPGRFDEYKKLTGRDKPVQDFLMTKTLMPQFIKNAQNIVDIAVQDYLSRDFENLMINFGCTGGQHRSVFSADTMATYLRERYNVKVTVTHTEQEIKNWIN